MINLVSNFMADDFVAERRASMTEGGIFDELSQILWYLLGC
jgi:hypothetical protein